MRIFFEKNTYFSPNFCKCGCDVQMSKEGHRLRDLSKLPTLTKIVGKF